ncbi:MAG: hypothetical protein JO263_01080 [Candidatus Eremiobacteraeota bacterium]|nr:hypothetical protein [Candidatus Eremiobacteraeota bacterium]
MKFFAIIVATACLWLGALGAARAQETPSPATPAPMASPTLMDEQYDGATHITAAPYLWAPTVGGTFQFTIPNLPRRPAGVQLFSASVAPTQYLPKVNSAIMTAFDIRKGDYDLFADYIYLNATMSASTSATLSGPLGKVQVPVSLSTTARLRQSIWEAAVGATIAHGHTANLDFFAGMREFPLSLSFGYNAVIGKRMRFFRNGSIQTGDIAQDFIFGLRGKAFFGDGHWYVPYYIDYGTGVGHLSNETWQGYSGGGYAFNHGQTLLLVYRALNYGGFSGVSHVQKLAMYGPLLGYTFGL